MNNKQILKFELSPKDVQIKNIINKELLELEILAISDEYPNRNKSAFTKEGMEKSKHTCYNKPILGCFDLLTNDFKEHNGEDRYDKELENYYWDTSGADAEKILGVIRESDNIDIVEHDGHNWLKIGCVIWTMYSYRQVKKLLKSTTKKVSVEILVKSSHFDDKGIQVIDEFILTGITILGDKVSEGIPGAHLNILDLMGAKDFSNQVKCLSFAYNKENGSNDDIKLDMSGLDIDEDVSPNNEKMEGKHMTYGEKLAFLTGKLAEVCGGDDCRFWVCDFSDDFIIINDYEEGKYFKIPYSLITDEDKVEVTFDLEGKVEQVPTFKDVAREFVTIGEENKNIDELFALYNESEEKFANLEGEFNSFKEETEAKVYSIVIDEVEYNVESLNEKYVADIAAKDEEISLKAEEFASKEEELKNAQFECEAVKEELSALKEKVAEDEAEKLCGDGIALADDEDDLDEDDKKCIKEKCSKHEYSSIEEVENDIARALYQKKKNNRSKNFKSNIPGNPAIDEEANISIFDKLN